MSNTTDIKPLLGLMGVLLAAITTEFNDQVTAGALADVLGALHISHDAGTWISSLYVTAQVFGMVVAPWSSVTFSARRFALAVIALDMVATLLVPVSTSLPFIYGMRILQGFSEGLTVPLLMATALRVLSPPIRLYGLGFYALTATFTPAFATTLTALWVDHVGWQFVFLEAIPFCALSAALIWYGMPQDPLRLERLRQGDWGGLVLAYIGLGSFSTMLQQGDRLDWFNSPLIVVLAVLSAVATPLFLVNEWFHPLPWFRLQLLGRRNLSYGLIALFSFLLIALSGSQLPLTYLREIQDYRPEQAYPVTLIIAASQLVLLPLIAKLLDFEWVDSRVVSFIGLLLILASCVGSSYLTIYWERDQFYFLQALQALGQPMVIMPLLMMATNSIDPSEGPFGSALFNTPRAIAEATGVWLIQLIDRKRGALHVNRLLDQAGQTRFSTVQAAGVVPDAAPLLANGTPRTPGSLQAFSHAIQQQATILTLSDTYLVLAAITVGLMVVLLFLPVRTSPPRIQLAKKQAGAS